MVRVPSSEIGILERAVETRVQGVICPAVDTPEEAARVVAACRGALGRDVMSIIQIESVEGFENMDEIFATPHLDGVLPGPSDLSVSFGGPPGLDYTGEVSVGRLRRIVDTAHAHGLKVTMPVVDRASIETAVSWGIDWVTLIGDAFWIANGGRAALADARDVLAGQAVSSG
jgi:4-hydroxy-2-oxoheptanedioate aldolase